MNKLLFITKNHKAMNHQPKFYRGWKLIELAGKTALGYYSFLKMNNKPLKIRDAAESFKVSLKLRKQLYLTKVIKFNNKYYSTPAIPGFPSSVFNNMIANGGLNYLQAGTAKKKHIDSVLLAISNKCDLKCTHCYEFHNLNRQYRYSCEEVAGSNRSAATRWCGNNNINWWRTFARFRQNNRNPQKGRQDEI